MPPKKKNKPSKNGFFQFVLEYRDRSNKHYANMQDLTLDAGNHWKRMSKEEKQPYEEMARVARDGGSRVKYTTDGIPLEYLENQQKEEIRKKQEMREEINNLIKEGGITGFLSTEVFFVIHVNHLFYHPASDRYFPCEIAIAPFNLSEGVNVDNVFHRIVKTGKLPIGYRAEIQLNSEQTHQLAPLALETGEDTNLEVFSDVIAFLKLHAQSNKKQPILYAASNNIKIVKKVLDTWYTDFGAEHEFKVYDLHYLFFALHNALATLPTTIWNSETPSHILIQEDVYSHTNDISCDFHEMADVCVYCSKAIVTRLIYVVCDHCLGKHELVAGKHVPTAAKLPVVSLANTRSNSVSSNLNTYEYTSRTSEADAQNYSDSFQSFGAKSTSSNASSFRPVKFRPGPPRRNYAGAAAGESRAAASANPGPSRLMNDSFKSLSIDDDCPRDLTKLNFPEPGWKKRKDSQDSEK